MKYAANTILETLQVKYVPDSDCDQYWLTQIMIE